ncbi:hypothetical protein [Zavarzinella formosa]|uniref:hypothetical protein n=1 Tax=Zavarzinella formosa TaxID=360055 RepID=UPI0002E0A914|nr:hypothetical protein [Zavarzinella formosa]
MTHVFSSNLIGDQGEILGTFKTHWQAVAAMIRLSNPNFRSTGGDKPEARHTEDEMRRRMKLTAVEWDKA